MMHERIFEEFFKLHGDLKVCQDSIYQAFSILRGVFMDKKKVLVCGNGGSAADAEHITGELMKGFVLPRAYESSSLPGRKLQRGLPSISLPSQLALNTAIANDNGEDLVFAQQVLGYGVEGDCLWALSTTGNSPNVVNAAKIAAELKLKVIGMTGEGGGALKGLCDCCICVPASETYLVQELHLPVYHLLCLMLEYCFFG